MDLESLKYLYMFSTGKLSNLVMGYQKTQTGKFTVNFLSNTYKRLGRVYIQRDRNQAGGSKVRKAFIGVRLALV